MRATMNIAGYQRLGLIRGVQRALANLSTGNSVAVTIRAVVTGCTLLAANGHYTNNFGSKYPPADHILLEMTNATTVTAYRVNSSGVNSAINFELIEFFPGVLRSIQRGYMAVTSGLATITATVTAVDINKAWLRLCGDYINADVVDGYAQCRLSLTNLTTLTYERWTTDTTAVTCYYELAEFN